MESRKLSFENGRGQTLFARLDSVLVEAGIAVLRFDFTGLGENEGDFADTNFTSNTEDLVAAGTW